MAAVFSFCPVTAATTSPKFTPAKGRVRSRTPAPEAAAAVTAVANTASATAATAAIAALCLKVGATATTSDCGSSNNSDSGGSSSSSGTTHPAAESTPIASTSVALGDPQGYTSTGDNPKRGGSDETQPAPKCGRRRRRRTKRRTRAVRFCTVLKVYLIPRAKDYSESTLWWSKEQLDLNVREFYEEARSITSSFSPSSARTSTAAAAAAVAKSRSAAYILRRRPPRETASDAETLW
eukprot:g15248.t1